MRQSTMTEQSQWSGVRLLLATVTATELAMLNIIFWAQAQGTIPGLVLAVAWPWAVAFIAPMLWTLRRQRSPRRRPVRLTLHPRLSLAIGLVLAAAALLSQLVSVA
jgi:hypothetical protein